MGPWARLLAGGRYRATEGSASRVTAAKACAGANATDPPLSVHAEDRAADRQHHRVCGLDRTPPRPSSRRTERRHLFEEEELDLEAQLPVGRVLRPVGVVVGRHLGVHRQAPHLEQLATPPPTGTVHWSLALAVQSAVMTGELVMYHPCGRL